MNYRDMEKMGAGREWRVIRFFSLASQPTQEISLI